MSADVRSDAGWLTWPNLVTAVRLGAAPALLLAPLRHESPRHRGVAAWRRWARRTGLTVSWHADLHQVSNVGKIIDPVADRILSSADCSAVAAAGGVPWWFASTTLTREVIVSVLTVVLAALGAARIDVLWWGKVSTFALMTSFPLFLLTTNPHHAALRPWQHDASRRHVGDRHHGTDALVDRARRLRANRRSRALRTGRRGRQIL